MSASYSTAGSERIQIAEIEIADETASILLRLVNGRGYTEQCECAVENSTLVIRNGYVVAYGNLMRIDIEKYGSVKQSTVILTQISFTKQPNLNPRLVVSAPTC